MKRFFGSVLSLFMTVTFAALQAQAQAGEPFPLRLRVGTYNVGHFNQGHIGGYQSGEAGGAERAVKQWRQWISRQAFDIFFVNEWNRAFDKDGKIDATEALLKPCFNTVCFGRQNTWIYNGIATNYKLENIRQVVLTHRDYYATVADMKIGGKTITLMSVHIPWQVCCHETSVDSLIAEMKKYDYLICGGDMNARDHNQLKFAAAGFNIANGGNEGWLCTAAGKCMEGISDTASHIDNIITTANIRIMNVSAPLTGLNDNDHLPVLADVVITDGPPHYTSLMQYADSVPTTEKKELRVLTYNIHIGIGMDDKLDLQRIAKTVTEQQPDLVALQEVDRFTDRTQKLDEVEELARLTGMEAVFGKTFGRSNGDYGIAILSKLPVLAGSYTQLPRLGQREDRGVTSVILSLNSQIIRFACTHFCHESEERRIMQAEKINELFTGDGIPTIIGGDFNAKPEDKSITTLKTLWMDATDAKPTFPAPSPNIKIDYIFCYPHKIFKVKKTKVVEDSVSSDHRPVLTTLEPAF
jgi:endonuclease/exonuclease/phosphatase family metal-dependent hydrolase